MCAAEPLAEAWASGDVAALLRALRDADPHALVVSDGAGGALDREAFWRIACGVSQAAATASGTAYALLPPTGAAAQAWLCGAIMAGRPFALLDARDPPVRSAEICAALGLAECLAGPGLALPPGMRALPAPVPADLPARSASDPDAPAIIVPTSGSTGRPKGIVHSRRALSYRIRQHAEGFGLRPGIAYLSTATDGSYAGLTSGFGCVLSGAHLLRVDGARIGLAGVLRAAGEAGGVSALQGVPSVLSALLSIPGAERALGGVRRCQSGSAQLLAADLRTLRAALPAACQLVNVYGITEAGALLRWDLPAGWQPDGPRIPAGVPLPGHRLAILDEAGAALPPGEVGELVASGANIALGEWRDGALAETPRIAPDPAAPGERVLRTGDLARIRPDGLYEIVGRADRQVKIGGRRIELEEIEDRLRRAPGVTAAAVLADRDAPGGARIHAAVATAEPPGEIEARLRRDLRAALPAHMQPARLLVLPELPMLPGGKVDGVGLLALCRAAPRGPDAPVAPDARLARAWRVALGRPPEPGLSFRETGGDSLAFLQLVLEVERLTRHPAVLGVLHEGMDAAEMSAALAAPPPAGQGPRVLLLPGIGGDSEALARLREGCPALDMVVARYPSWRALARAGAEVEADAAALLDQALEAFPEGRPPILAAYSYGGAVAVELARLLAAAGRPARSLLLLDCGFRRWAAAPGGQPARTRKPGGLFDALHWRARRAGAEPERARRAAWFLPAHPPPGLAALRLWRELEFSLREHALMRWGAREVRPVAVPATLFLSEQLRPGAPRDLGWPARCDLQAIVPVRGDHEGMIRPPHRAALCAALTAAVLALDARV